MNHYALQVSPLAKGAYYSSYIDVASKELATVAGITEYEHKKFSNLEFFYIDAEPNQLDALSRLSFVQGIFECSGDQLTPLQLRPNFALHEDFVFGAKYKGKTNEVLTQLLLNIGLSMLPADTQKPVKLLDPMCGRGTTLLWALRYGLNCKGIEQDTRALGEIRQHIKKWCKLHHQKHIFSEGFIGPANKQGTGKFFDFEMNQNTLRAITGDSIDAPAYLKSDKFNLIVTDIPYGIQFKGKQSKRSPIDTLVECIPSWVRCLRKGGVLVLSFNKYMPRRAELVTLFQEAGLIDLEFEAPHRMSESIVRDILVMRK